MLSQDEISFEIVDVEGSIAIVEITTPRGKVSICGQLVLAGRLLIAAGVHVEGLSIGMLGRRGMNVIAQKVMEVVDVDTIVVFWRSSDHGCKAGGTGLVPSASTAYDLVMKPGGLPQPVTLIQSIAALGPGLSKAHETVKRLANGGTVRVMLNDSDPQAVERLEELGVTATLRG